MCSIGIYFIAMNILLVLTKGGLGGTQSCVLDLARWLTSHGHSVTVGFGVGSFLRDALIDEGIQTVQFKSLRRTINPFKNLLFIRELQKHVDLYDTDVVHFNNPNSVFGGIGAKWSRTKPAIVYTVHGLSVLDPQYEMHPLVRRAYYGLFRFLFKWVDAVVFVSQHNMEIANKTQLFKQGYVVYNGVDMDALGMLSRCEAREHLIARITEDERSKSAFLIGSIGRLAYQKNYEFIINVFPLILEKNPNAQLVVIGEGGERQMYELLIKKLRLESVVHLVGEMEFAARYVRAFDLFVLPSRYEGMSITVLETISAGIPVLVSNVAGNEEIVGGDDRQLHVLNDESDFLSKIEPLMHNETLREQVCRYNQERGELFHISKTGEGYVKLYQQLVSEK